VTPERDLARLLRDLRPVRAPDTYVFASKDGPVPPGLAPFATVREAEGTTVVLTRAEADASDLPYDFVAARITLTVASALDAVGLTAAVAGRLAEAGIACNVIAGLHHDHLFVPASRADEALALLSDLGREAS
jgi:hypothetical protein